MDIAFLGAPASRRPAREARDRNDNGDPPRRVSDRREGLETTAEARNEYRRFFALQGWGAGFACAHRRRQAVSGVRPVASFGFGYSLIFRATSR